ncbi:two-component sensor histidine kinase [Pseudoclavibacter endophyticus]|nr:two-component sensor histidine kinase [Pseudoclavibacter endophyticus]
MHWTVDIAFALLIEVLIGWPYVMLASSRVYLEPLLFVPWVLYFAAIVLRRPTPGFALWLCVIAVLFKAVTGTEPHGQDLAIGIVLYSAAAYGSRRLRWFAIALCGLFPALLVVFISVRPMRSFFLSIYETVIQGGPILVIVVGAVLWTVFTFLLLMCWLAGTARRAQANAAEAAHRREVAELESLRSREQLFVEQERNRIARDMHDVVAHSLAVVVAQADGGRYAMRANPQAGEQSLATIAETAREALYEVRGLLGQLRHSQPEGPQRGFADLPAVLERMRAAGLRLEIEAKGEPRPLGKAADTAMFRLVQEACTNSLRHGDPRAPTVISVAWSDELHVRVTNVVNPVPPPPRPDSGHGLIGMRERIVTAGGRLETGRHGDHFVVSAVVPTAALATHGGPVDVPPRDDAGGRPAV